MVIEIRTKGISGEWGGVGLTGRNIGEFSGIMEIFYVVIGV